MTTEGERACGFTPGAQQVGDMAEALCEHALYARAEEQRQGFVTLRGGHRMGLCGRVVAQGTSVRALRDISSLCVRVAGQWEGAADTLVPHLTSGGRVRSALIIGLPGSGKTTVLRDACRQLSDAGHRVAIADERSELAAMSRGAPQLDVGARTDVLDGVCKEIALRWLLRSMSPEIIATDELGAATDALAVLEAAQSGVAVLATAHARTLDEALSRGTLYHLAQNKAFSRYAVLDEKRAGRIAGIYDESMQPLYVGGEQ